MREEALITIPIFEKIRKDYQELYFKNNLSDQTFEGQFINHVDKTLIFLNLNLKNFVDNLCSKIKFDQILPTHSINDYNEVLKTYFTQTKSSFIYNFSSITETYFRNVHKLIFPKINMDNKNLYDILKNVFAYFKISEDIEWKALMVLSNMRNTIHNNGYHISKDREIIYRKYKINFRFGYPHNAAYFEMLECILVDIKQVFLLIHIKLNSK